MSRLRSPFKGNVRCGVTAVTFTLVAIFLAPTALFAQSVRHYEYANIDVTYAVQRDSTVVVTEQQTYDFTGAYHQGERVIPHKGSGAITDVSVTDSSTGQALVYAGSRTLDKNNPDSWGKYTVTNSNGNTVIDWYYDLADTTHTWQIGYTLHGAITFANDHDELYWNLFDSYTVPVLQTSVTVVLPEPDTLPSATFYVNGEHGVVASRPDDRTFRFTASDFAPGEAATVAVGWQKGLVTEQSYWRDMLWLYWQYALSLLLFLGSLLYALLYRAWTHPNRSGRTIIAAYEPPKDLDVPLAASLLELPARAVAAPEIVDLAVRGYLTITELPLTLGDRFRKWAGYVVLGLLAMLFLTYSLTVGFLHHSETVPGGTTAQIIFGVIFFGIVILVGLGIHVASGSRSRRQYELTRTAKTEQDLPSYEQTLLMGLFSFGATTCSTAVMASSTTSQQYFMSQLRESSGAAGAVLDERGLYMHSHSVDSNGAAYIILPIVLMFFSAVVSVVFYQSAVLHSYAAWVLLPVAPYLVLAATAFLAYRIAIYAMRYQLALNDKGRALRDELMGFKLYLSTAEKYRMQNLTQETFEKYLPYAMLFGVEKKWVNAFAGVGMVQSTWYVPAPGTSIAVGAAAFSPAAFSSSFSASFSSAVSGGSSGGFSGGGGFAGGGGGGGGGGAS